MTELTKRQRHLLVACVEAELESNNQGDTALSLQEDKQTLRGELQALITALTVADSAGQTLKPVHDAYEAHAIYKDYDGDAPDSDNLVICSTEELAKEVAGWCAEHDTGSDEDDEDNDNEYSFPCSDGWEGSATYCVRPVIARLKDIAQTLDEAIKAFQP